MNIVITVLSSVLVFGFLIFIHEFGHYITARAFHITIEEFSIGMGPRLISWVSKRSGIRYSIALLPIGGFVAMPGENGEYNADAEDDGAEDPYRDDPNTFGKKPAWQRFIVTAAGAAVNITAGFLAMILLTSITNIGDTTVKAYHTKESLSEAYGMEITELSCDSGLAVGDKILAVDGKRVRILDELSYEIMRRGDEPVDILVERGGEQMLIENVVFPRQNAEGQTFGIMDFKVARVEKNVGTVLSYSWSKSVLIVRMCWESIYDLITGRYSFTAVSGPVGISSAIGNAVTQGFSTLLYITVLISINLGVMNLLPVPALDGGRLIVLIVEMITRKRMPAKVEGMINGIGLALLLLLSVVVMIKDVIQLII